MNEHIRKFLDKIIEYEEIALLLFPITSLYIAPIFHEFGHIATLYLMGCPYTSDLKFSFLTGVYGVIKPLCELTWFQALLVLSSGTIVTVVTGSALLVMAYVIRKKIFVPILMNSVALGFFFPSVIDMFTGEGDIILIMSMLEIKVNYPLMMAFSVILIIAGISYFWWFVKKEEKSRIA